MLVSRRVALAAMLLLAAVLGCGHGPTQPPVAIVLMSLSATASAPLRAHLVAGASTANRVTLSAKVINAGPTQVWHYGCCYTPMVGIDVLGPDGKVVLLTDPKIAASLDCPCGPAPFPTGEDRSSSLTFNGTLYVPDSPDYPSPTYAAPAGRYTVIATYAYWVGAAYPQTDVRSVERRTTFDWRP